MAEAAHNCEVGEGEKVCEARAGRCSEEEEWSQVSAYAELPRLHSRRMVQAASAGLLLVAAVAVVLLRGAEDEQVSTLQQQLQFMYAAPGTIPLAQAGFVLPGSPTLWRAADAVARARAAVGTAYLRRQYSNVPGISATYAAPVMPAAAYASQALRYGALAGMPASYITPRYATVPALGYGAPAAAARPPLAAYRVSIPVGMQRERYGMPMTVGPVASYGMPVAAGPMTRYAMPAAHVATLQDMSVNAAINAGANAAAGASTGVPTQPAAVTDYGYGMVPGMATVPQYGTPTVSVKTPMQTVTMSSSQSWPPVTAIVPQVPGAQTMKIVAGPGKGRMVEVTSAGKIIGSPVRVAAGVAVGVGVMPATPAVGVVAPLMSTFGAYAPMPAILPRGSVLERLYTRLSGKDHAVASSATAATAAHTASKALALTSQAAGLGHNAGSSRATSQESSDATSQESSDVPADEAEGDAAQAEAKANGVVSLTSNRVSSSKLPQLNLLSKPPPLGKADDSSSDEVSERQLVSRRQSARRADRYSDMAPQGKRDMSEGSQVLVSVPDGKRPGDFFSAEVAGRGLMLVEVPEGVQGGDELQMLQMPTEAGEALEWIKYAGSNKHATHGAGPRQEDPDRLSAERDNDRKAWSLGNQAPRSFFH